MSGIPIRFHHCFGLVCFLAETVASNGSFGDFILSLSVLTASILGWIHRAVANPRAEWNPTGGIQSTVE